MKSDRTELQQLARQLLESGQVEVVLGHTRGSDPLTAVPLFAARPEQSEALVYDFTCGFNLARFVRRYGNRRVAVVTKGCDERSLIGLIQEKQIRRELLIVIGVPCAGVIDPHLVRLHLRGQVVRVSRTGQELEVVLASGDKRTLPLTDLMHRACRVCRVRNPRFADYLIGEQIAQPAVSEFDSEMENLAAASRSRRWVQFRRETDKCILCLACRNVCPACYCSTCFAESSQPRWLTRTSDVSDAIFFHLGRLMHLAGRCTGCGACERACPMGVRLGLYMERLRKDVKELFGFEAGVDPAAEQPFACFRPDDTNKMFR